MELSNKINALIKIKPNKSNIHVTVPTINITKPAWLVHKQKNTILTCNPEKTSHVCTDFQGLESMYKQAKDQGTKLPVCTYKLCAVLT